MAPTAISQYQESDIKTVVSKSTTKHEVKTSGQHPPTYEELKPYEDFPKQIEGKTVWRTEEYKGNPERWTHRFTPEEIAELGTTADNFNKSGIPLPTISKVNISLRRSRIADLTPLEIFPPTQLRGLSSIRA